RDDECHHDGLAGSRRHLDGHAWEPLAGEILLDDLAQLGHEAAGLPGAARRAAEPELRSLRPPVELRDPLADVAGASGLVEVHQGLNGLALAEVVAKRLAPREVVVVLEPELEETAGRVAGAGVARPAPGIDCLAQAVDHQGLALAPALDDLPVVLAL